MKVVKLTLGDGAIEERCSGAVKEHYQGKAYENAEVHMLERALSEIQRALRYADTVIIISLYIHSGRRLHFESQINFVFVCQLTLFYKYKWHSVECVIHKWW